MSLVPSKLWSKVSSVVILFLLFITYLQTFPYVLLTSSWSIMEHNKTELISYFILGLYIFGIIIYKRDTNFSWLLYNNVNFHNKTELISYFILGLDIFGIIIYKRDTNFSWLLYNNVNVVKLFLSSLEFLHSER